MPLEVEIGAFRELAEATNLAESWETITGIPFPRDEDDWFELVGRGDIPVELFVSGKIRPRHVLRYLEGRLAQQPDAGAGPTRAKGPTRRKHRQRSPGKLTAKQLQAVQAFGNCNGNYARTAAELGVCRATAKQHIEAAYRKLGQKVPKTPMTRALPTDRRGNVSVDRDRRHG